MIHCPSLNVYSYYCHNNLKMVELDLQLFDLFVFSAEASVESAKEIFNCYLKFKFQGIRKKFLRIFKIQISRDKKKFVTDI